MSGGRFAAPIAAIAAWACSAGSEEAAAPEWTFREVPGAFGEFLHVTGARGEYFLPETMGPGCALADLDGDGDLDAFLVGGEEADGLYRNGGGRWKLEARLRVEGAGTGMGCVAGDFDGDGDLDLYSTRVGPNALWRNDGAGRFEVAKAARVGDSAWSVSATFFDADGDGDLDLYVVNYVAWTPESNRACFTGTVRDYCTPRVYEGVQDTYYRNEGDGTFAESTAAAGLVVGLPLSHSAKGLGVVAADLEEDGDPDLYVANDSTPNFLFRNRGDGRFEEVGLEMGVAVSAAGLSQAGMGVDAGDADGDGDLDLFVTNLDLETNAYYRNDGAWFVDAGSTAGLAAPSLGLVGFGTNFLDADLDGDLDLLVANGHILVHVEEVTGTLRTRQPLQLFANGGGGRFEDVAPSRAPDLTRPRIARGSAVGDVEGDGDLDLLVVENGGPAALFENVGLPPGRGIALDLVGTRSNRQGIGARVRAQVEGRTILAEVRSASSYASSGEARVTLGLAGAPAAERIEIRWPSGSSTILRDVPPGRFRCTER